MLALQLVAATAQEQKQKQARHLRCWAAGLSQLAHITSTLRSCITLFVLHTEQGSFFIAVSTAAAAG
jgi:hypothetical protein